MTRGFVVAFVASFLALSNSFANLEERKEAKHKEALKLTQQAGNKMKEKAWAEAIDMYTKAIELSALNEKGEAQTRLNRAIAYMNTTQCEKAVPDLDLALATLVDEPSIYFTRALCRAQLKQSELAFSDIGKAIELKPAEASFRRVRCLMYYNERKIAEAMPDCDLALAANPDDLIVLQAVGSGQESLKNFAQARKAYQKILEKTPDDKTALDGLKRLEGK
jgi:tetratricopeptide (TPR) repeat protein